MPKKLNLIGQRFGKLVVIAHAENKGRRTQWLCKCDCGNEKICLTESLQNGKCKSCGCLRIKQAQINGKKVLQDLTNQRFGKLVVLKYAGSNRDRSQWLCQCDCGNEVIVNQMELKKGQTLSCGCLRSSFGELIINNILQDNHILFQREYQFNDLLSENNIPLRFDFAIFNNDNSLKCLIEYDGEQHFSNKTDKIWKDNFSKRQLRDNQKNQYCLSHNIPLYRIPYWEKNNITLELIFNKKYLITS